MDVGHYLWIAQHGYNPDNPSNAFYPLWPAILKISGISASPNAPAFAALTAFALWAWSMRRLYLWIQKRFGEPVAWSTLLVFLLLPSSIFFWVGFTESLFLALFVTYLTGLRSINRFPALAAAYSDESGHLFRFVSDTDPTISDSCRSEATLVREH
jgi:hypothetical protein